MHPDSPIPAWIHRICTIRRRNTVAFYPSISQELPNALLVDICASKWGEAVKNIQYIHIIFSDTGEGTWDTHLVNDPQAAGAQVNKN